LAGGRFRLNLSPLLKIFRTKVMATQFIRDESGQDMVEYTLLLAFIALVGAAVFIGMGETSSSIWTIVNSRMANANEVPSP
jgi:Flp pilus assembly pilin Flp